MTGGTTKPAEYETVIVPWYEDLHARAENKRLLQEYAKILEKIQTTVAACADAINAQRNAPVQATPVIDADTLMATPQPMPWGNPQVGPDAGCWGGVGDAILDRLYGGWEDATRLAGFDPETFDPSQDWLSQRNNLTTFFTVMESVDALAVTILAAFPATHLIPRGNAYFDAKRQQGIDNWAAMISYDTEAARNGEDPWHRYGTDLAGAWTDNVLNVSSLALAIAAPTFGIPAFLRALRRASRREYDTPRPASPDNHTPALTDGGPATDDPLALLWIRTWALGLLHDYGLTRAELAEIRPLFAFPPAATHGNANSGRRSADVNAERNEFRNTA